MTLLRSMMLIGSSGQRILLVSLGPMTVNISFAIAKADTLKRLHLSLREMSNQSLKLTNTMVTIINHSDFYLTEETESLIDQEATEEGIDQVYIDNGDSLGIVAVNDKKGNYLFSVNRYRAERID